MGEEVKPGPDDDQQGVKGNREDDKYPGYMAAVKADLREKYGEELRKYQNINPIIEDYFSLKAKMQDVVLKPKEDASEEEWLAYKKQIGIPLDAGEYDLDKPPEEIGDQKEFDTWFKDIALKTNMTKEQAKTFYNEWNNLQKTAIEARVSAAKETEKTIRKELGSDYDKAMANAAKIVELGGEDLTGWLDETGAGNDPRFVKVFAKLGALISEDSIGSSGSGKAGAEKSFAERLYPTQGE